MVVLCVRHAEDEGVALAAAAAERGGADSPRRARRSSRARVRASRAPLMPTGWPRAMAPPLTLTRSGDTPRSRIEARATAANASLISISSRSATSRAPPGAARRGSHSPAGAAARGPARRRCHRRRSGYPRQALARARSLLITTTAQAPSDSWDADPAVIVPPSLNAGASLASRSAVVPGRTPSSFSTGHRVLADVHHQRHDLLGQPGLLSRCGGTGVRLRREGVLVLRGRCPARPGSARSPRPSRCRRTRTPVRPCPANPGRPPRRNGRRGGFPAAGAARRH